MIVLGGKSFRVVGESRDHLLHEAGTAPPAMAFVPFWQNAFEPQVDARVAVRVRGDPSALLPLLRTTISAVDRSVPITEVMPMTAQVAGTYSLVGVAARVASAAGVIALFLSAIGLYGVIAFLVARGTHDIGVRLAIGARPRQVAAFYVRRGLTTTALGVAIGLIVTLLATRLLASWLFGVQSVDLTSLSTAVFSVATVGLIAAYLPARRAARVDPLIALRVE
jgi:putative ABC transport system permease protein